MTTDSLLPALKHAAMKQATLEITSTAFSNNAPIPGTYTCDGENINPPLSIKGIPDNASHLAIILDDPDAPSGTFTHWMVWDMPPSTSIEENSQPEGTVGQNDFGKHNYMGPCPPGGKEHRYFFKVYALDSELGLSTDTSKQTLESTLHSKAIAYGELVGIYRRR